MRAIGLFAAAVSVTLFSGATASFAYNDWRPTYNPYSYGYRPYSSGTTQIISIDMDPKHLLNASFRIAARENRLVDMRQFIQQGADIDSVSDMGRTALIYAAENCLPEAVHELLSHGANPNIADVDGDTALIYATTESCLPVVQMLIKTRGVKLHVRDREERTALDYAKDCAELDVDGPAAQILVILSRAAKRL